MSRSHIVDDAYRLRPEDLTGRPWRAVVANVTLQGLEALQPVLHLQGIARRLVLDEAQCRALVDITGSTAMHDWIGVAIELQPATVGGQSVIVIRAPEGGRPRHTRPALSLNPELRQWLLSLAVVAIMLALSALYVQANWAQIAATLGALFGAPSLGN